MLAGYDIAPKVRIDGKVGYHEITKDWNKATQTGVSIAGLWEQWYWGKPSEKNR